MLHITVNGETFKYEADKLLNTEAMALQKVTGMKVSEWADALKEGDPFAQTALVWLLYRRDRRTTAFDDIEFDMAAVEVVDDEEKPETVDPTPLDVAEDVATI